MKNGRCAIYRAERKRGLTVGEIADKYGVSKQCVSQACCVYGEREFKPLTNTECIYLHLREWINTNKIKRSRLIYLLGLEPVGANYTKMNKILTGKGEPKKGLIDKLIKLTGIPYAMLFWEG